MRTNVFYKGDTVKVIAGNDVEFGHYTEGFFGKTGTITEITQTDEGVHGFRVDFNSSLFGIFYRNELELVTK